MSDTLAVDGGTPVRSRPLPPPYPGGTILGDREKCAVLRVLDRRSPFRYYGPDVVGTVRDVETWLAEPVGTSYALAVTSGTAALIVALHALGVGIEDEVIVPAVTFMASPLAVIACNAVPVLAEVNDSLCLDATDAEARITDRTGASMPVHPWGLAANMDAVSRLAHAHDLAVLEHCAQSLGASWHGRPIGGIGDISALSFQFNKVAPAVRAER